MNASRNKYRHKWIDKGRAAGIGDTYVYTCKHCGKHRVKLDFVSFAYYDANNNPLGNTAPECVKPTPTT